MNQELIKILLQFTDQVKKERNKLPYHINLLDVVWANENAHSQILGKLLLQQDKDGYGILKSFYKLLSDNISSFLPKDIIRPDITIEKDRIDLLIMDKDFAVIIENKVHNAIDQECQLARYIEKVLLKGYKKENIYVIYLTRDGGKKVESQSWTISLSNGEIIEYQEEFMPRFLPMSFKEHLVPWLREEILPYCKIKDTFLTSAIEQYIDFFDGLFYQRKIQTKMTEKLQKNLAQLLNIESKGSLNQQRNELLNVKNEIQAVVPIIDSLIKERDLKMFDNWSVELQKRYKDLSFSKLDKDFNLRQIGIKGSYKDIEFVVMLEYNIISKTIYYGLGRHYSTDHKCDDIYEIICESSKDCKDNWWYSWNRVGNFEDACTLLTKLYEETIKRIKNKA